MGFDASGTPAPGEAVLIYAPTGRDAELILNVLQHAGHSAAVVGSIDRLCQRFSEECGVAILTEEALTEQSVGRLLEALVSQPSWADLPLVVLTTVLAMQRTEQPALRILRRHGNVYGDRMDRPASAPGGVSTRSATICWSGSAPRSGCAKRRRWKPWGSWRAAWPTR